jgi:glycosyltransferase involved in cell wall biosynthesis
LRRLLGALSDQTIEPASFEVIVVDDCSDDGTFALLEALMPRVPYRLRPLRSSVKRGPGPSRNAGLAQAAAPLIAFIDDDCLPSPSWLEGGVDEFLRDPGVGVVQGKTVPSDPQAFTATARHYSVDVPRPSPNFESCNIFYRKLALEEVGGFAQGTCLCGVWCCEDVLTGWLTVEAGWSRRFSEKALVEHDVELRSLDWWIKKSLLLHESVGIAAQHPGFRRAALWRVWILSSRDAAFMLAGAGLTLRWRPAAVLVLPYLRMRHPSLRQRHVFRQFLDILAIDSARRAGILYGACRHRVLII